MNNEYSIIAVRDLTFYKVDDKGEALRGDDGRVLVFEAPDYDYSSIAASVDEYDLEERG